jgi:hypothetical protein
MFETTEATDKTEDNLLHFGYIYRFQGSRNSVGNAGHYRTKIISYWLDLGDSSKAFFLFRILQLSRDYEQNSLHRLLIRLSLLAVVCNTLD